MSYTGAFRTPKGLRRLRRLLMGSVTASAVCLASGQVFAACTPSGSVLNCTGSQPGGIVAGPGITQIDATLSGNVTPAGDVDGIHFTNAGSLTLNSTTGSSSIITTGTGIGVDIVSSGSGSITATHSGDIRSKAMGINLGAATSLNLTATSDIDAANDAIHASSAGVMRLASTGNLSSSGGFGIRAQTTNGAISITSIGSVESSGATAISAVAAGTNNGVTIASTGNVTAGGSGSAIHAQAAAGATIGVAINSGTLTGGTGGGAAGVNLVGGGANTLINKGTITADADAIAAGNGWAVIATTGNETVTNNGIIIGNVNLAGGNNVITNAATGEFRPGDTVIVGTANMVTNFGRLRPGGSAIQTTGLTGNLTQAASGIYGVDINTASGAGDRITVSGNAQLAGSIAPNLVDRSLTTKDFIILSSGGTLSSTMLTVADTPAYDYELAAVNATELHLTIRLASVAALVASPLNGNQFATVTYIDKILDTTPPPDSAIVLFLDTIGGLTTESEIVAALDRLNPQGYLGALASTITGSQQFMNSLMSCPLATEDGVFIEREVPCYYATLKGRTTHWDHTSRNIGGDEDAGGVTGGAQGFIAPDLLLGGALSWERSSLNADNATSSDGDRITAGLVLKGMLGDTIISGAVFGGGGWFDTTRVVTSTITAEGEQDIGFGGLGLRLSHVFDQGGWYAKPIFDAGATYFSFGDIHEAGAGVANLIVDGENEWIFNVGAAVEFGSTVVLQQSLLARPFVRLGVLAFSESDFSLTSRFVGAPASVGPFTVTSHYDDVLADVGAGLDIFAIASGVSVNLSYDGKFGDNTTSHAGTAKLRMTF